MDRVRFSHFLLVISVILSILIKIAMEQHDKMALDFTGQ